MIEYKAPLRDMQFVLYELLEIDKHYSVLRGDDDVNKELISQILEEGAKFCESELSPLNQSGDQEGCQWNDTVVTTPKGFKEAYAKYVEAGWPALASDEALGGQGLPPSLNLVINEMTGTANWSWSMYPGLSHGCMSTLEQHGTEQQQQTYLTKLIEGVWTGTMCLTEPHCGTDLGMLRTKAEPNEDGTYSLTGTKIFISAGEHDMAENIVHIVLARLPGAPKGTKGISLFIVPKFLVKEDGNIGERNGVVCGSIEHKMGIKGSATCVLNFEGATGYLIGPENRGLNCMFTFMNVARIGTALQGVCAAELSYQGAVKYAKERLAMRSLSGPKNPDGEADPIIVHPAVRQMLLTQKAFAEGGRALCYYLSKTGDTFLTSKDEAAVKAADDMMALLTPIAKAFITEAGLEAANHGVQVYGGHGFIQEWGMEQIVRDTRIATLYEGTTQIQALDLLGRKVMLTGGEVLKGFTAEVSAFCEANIDNPKLGHLVKTVQDYLNQWNDMTQSIGARAMENPEEVGAAAVDYCMFAGYVTLGFLWARMAIIAQDALDNGSTETGFYTAKVQTAEFYFSRLLPRAGMHAKVLEAPLSSLMSMEVDNFAV